MNPFGELEELVGNDPGAVSLLQRVLQGPVEFDRFGLVVPRRRLHEVEKIVAPDLVEARSRIQQMMLEERTVIYFPGAFDLVHVGHWAYMLEGIEQVLQRTGLKREQLFVVVLTDADTLIEAAKPAHRYAANGGHPRPIESAEVFSHLLARVTPLNPRVIDLAQLGVDMVGMIPSPNDAADLLDSWTFQNWFGRFGNFENSGALLLADRGDDVSAEANQTLAEYRALVTAVKNGQLERIVTSFDSARFDLPPEGETPCWTLPSWQLLMHRFLGMVHKVPQSDCYRILSMRDSYSTIVQRLMELSGIRTACVNDTHILSTTTLLETYGWRDLYLAKVESFKRWRG